MENLTEKHDGSQRAGYGRTILFAHGKVDPVEAGRKGGRASVLARRLAGQRKLEERISSTKNGAALFSLYRVRLEREARLEEERLAADKELVAIEEQTIEEQERLQDLRRQVDEAEAQLEAALTDPSVLTHLLRNADERGLLEPCLVQLGFMQVDE
jgi:hypothetical protein